MVKLLPPGARAEGQETSAPCWTMARPVSRLLGPLSLMALKVVGEYGASG